MKTSVDFGVLTCATDEAMRWLTLLLTLLVWSSPHEGGFVQGNLTGSTGRTPIVPLSQWAGDVSVVPGLSTTVEQVSAHGSAEQVSARGFKRAGCCSIRGRLRGVGSAGFCTLPGCRFDISACSRAQCTRDRAGRCSGIGIRLPTRQSSMLLAGNKLW